MREPPVRQDFPGHPRPVDAVPAVGVSGPIETKPVRRWHLPRPVVLAVTSSALVLIGASAGAPAPLFVLYQHQYGITDADLTGSLVVYIVPAALALLMLGRLSNHIGRRTMSLLALASGVAGLLILTRVDGLAPLLIGRAFQGLGTGIAMSAIAAYVVDLDPPKQPGVPGRTATAVTSGGAVGGLAIGAIISGALVEYGADPRTLIYYIFSAALAVCALGIVLSRETSPRLPGAVSSLMPAVRIPPSVRALFIGASAIFIACWALAGFYQALAPSLSAVELDHTGSLFAGFAVAALVGPSAIGGPLTVRFNPKAAMIVGSTVLSLAVVGVLISVATGSTPAFFVASVIAGLAFGSAFHGGMRTLMGGLAPADRAGLLSGIYLFSYLGAAIPAFIAGELVTTWGLSTVTRSYGGLVVFLAILAMGIVTITARRRAAAGGATAATVAPTNRAA
jgi:MFS family permease